MKKLLLAVAVAFALSAPAFAGGSANTVSGSFAAGGVYAHSTGSSVQGAVAVSGDKSKASAYNGGESSNTHTFTVGAAGTVAGGHGTGSAGGIAVYGGGALATTTTGHHNNDN